MSNPVHPGEPSHNNSRERPVYAQSNNGLNHALSHRVYRPHQSSRESSSYNHINQAEWTTWQELSIKISDLPASTTTRDLWRCFNGQGNIIKIELYENQRGQRDGKATVRFRSECFFSHLITSVRTDTIIVRLRRIHFGRVKDTQYPLQLKVL